MSPQELVQAVCELRPELDPEEQLRLSLLVAMEDSTLHQFRAAQVTHEDLERVTAKVTAATDQHAAMADEIDSLAANAACEFQPEHLWTLVRALRVQGQILNMYLRQTQSAEF